MRAPFIVRIVSDDAGAARAVASRLQPALVERAAAARVETGEHQLPSTVATIGVLAPDGTPRWIDPLALDGAAPEASAARVVSFLERWGFITAAPAPAA